MAIKYNPYNWEIRPRQNTSDINIDIKFNTKRIEDDLKKILQKNVTVSISELRE